MNFDKNKDDVLNLNNRHTYEIVHMIILIRIDWDILDNRFETIILLSTSSCVLKSNSELTNIAMYYLQMPLPIQSIFQYI